MIPLDQKPKYKVQKLDKLLRAERPKNILVIEGDGYKTQSLSGEILRLTYRTPTSVEIISNKEFDELIENEARMKRRNDPQDFDFKDFAGYPPLETLNDRLNKLPVMNIGIYATGCICCSDPVQALYYLYHRITQKNTFLLVPNADENQIGYLELALAEDAKSRKLLTDFDLTDIFIEP